jgi:two-component system cell cycle sensor histidine kinase/response regulator CckA
MLTLAVFLAIVTAVSGDSVVQIGALSGHANASVTIAGRVTFGGNSYSYHRVIGYIQDGSGGALLRGDSLAIPLEVGDSVEAIGITGVSKGGVARLDVTSLRRVTVSKRMPTPAIIALSEVALQRHAGALVMLSGRVLSLQREHGAELLTLAHATDPTVLITIESTEDSPASAALGRFSAGDVITATGVLTRHVGNDATLRGSQYILYVRNRDDARGIGMTARERWYLLATIAVMVVFVLSFLTLTRLRERRMQRRLARAHSQLHAMFEVASDAILVLAPDWRIVEANGAAASLFERTREVLIGCDVRQILCGELCGCFDGAETELELGSHVDRELRVTGSEGKSIALQMRLTCTDVAGQGHMIAVMRDVTGQVRTEAELRGVFAAMTDIVLVLGRDGEYLKVPTTAASGLFAPSGELVGRNVRDILPGKEAEEVCAVIHQALAANEPVMYEYSLPFPDQVMWFSASVTRLDGDAVVWVARNITERRSLEAQLRQSQKIEAVGLLAGGVAHDFNNILTAISVNADFLVETLDGGESRRADAEEIQKAAKRASGLTQQLLAFSRKQILKPVVTDLNDIVAQTQRMLARVIGEDIEIVTRLSSVCGWVLVDPTQMEQVLLNLAVNARDAMPKGGTLGITTTNVTVDERAATKQPTLAAGSYVRLSMSDSGCGMSDHVQAHLFEPFFTTKEAGRGTGLGLSTVHGIVVQSGGHISVTSTVGLGSTFEILLPRVEAAASSSVESRRSPALPHGTETVLLVEDEPSVRAVAQRILRTQGYFVLAAENGQDALSVADGHQGNIDLVLTDAVMPVMSGSDVVRELQARRADIKVLFMSGYTENDMIRRDISTGAGTLLAKPFTAAALSQAVRKVLDSGTREGRQLMAVT